ncbi:hypothetical protein STSP2_03092 [Anaerohalosphaera lusitana]|uniref:Uncharacterized protein n=1 Tax=Anaerohalosphaera lusitana TaxID=1936003 RepID=A0A1U9NPM7_9BACT|nr:hypothetical protein [Anaerohalosphaera lusitana]AQT69892.1 hypothetical protein STSP2_03092 [Anaerohalosphaera lusitana]
MYIDGVIDVSLWNRAGWNGILYVFAAEAVPVVGLLFDGQDAGRKIFSRWKHNLGENDSRELIRFSIIEGDITSEPDGYSVFIGTNPKAAISRAKTRGYDIEQQMLCTGRFHRMTPPPESCNLDNFKKEYSKYNSYILAPAIQSSQGPIVLFELGIVKKDVNFLSSDNLKKDHLEYVVLKKEPEWNGKGSGMIEAITSKSESTTPEQVTEAIAVFETELASGAVEKNIDPMVIDSLAEVGYDENGLILPDTVNPALVATAELVRAEVIEREAARMPLIDVQKKYVEFLEYYFSKPYGDMKTHELTPHQMAKIMAKDKDYVEAWKSAAPEMFEYLKELWSTANVVTASHLRRMPTLKAVYGGNVFPHPESNLVSNVGLYADTIVLPDPIFSSLGMHAMLQPEHSTYILAKNALAAMSYKEWAIADVDVPILVFVPSYFYLSDQLPKIIEVFSQSDLQNHLGKVFDYRFNSFKDIEEYFEHAPDVEALASSVKNKERFVFDIEENPLPLDQIGIILDDFEKKLTIPFEPLPSKMRLLKSLQGRFMQANNVLAHCDLYGGIPIIDAPTSWQYFLWKLECSASQLSMGAEDTLVTHVLHEDLRNIPCFSKVPAQGIIELRRSNKLQGMREVFRRGIMEISSVDCDAVEDVTKKVSQNLRDALQEYETHVQELPKEIMSVSGQAVALAGSVGLGIAAASTGSIPLAIIAALSGSSGVSSAKDIMKKLNEIRGSRKRLKSNPVGIFWKV